MSDFPGSSSSCKKFQVKGVGIMDKTMQMPATSGWESDPLTVDISKAAHNPDIWNQKVYILFDVMITAYLLVVYTPENFPLYFLTWRAFDQTAAADSKIDVHALTSNSLLGRISRYWLMGPLSILEAIRRLANTHLDLRRCHIASTYLRNNP